MSENDERQSRTWGMLCHLTGLACYIGVPFGNILGPLIVWLIKKDEFPFVDDQGKESMNFQISMTIYAIVAGILIIFLVGLPLLLVLIIAHIVLIIVAAVKANEGEAFRYPFIIRFIS